MSKKRGHRLPVPLDRQLAEKTMPIPFCGCIIWLGCLSSRGYGKMTYHYATLLAHRVAWELANGRSIPEGMYICHRCDEPSCVNPDHLFLGTPLDNMADMISKGRKRTVPVLSDEAVMHIRATRRQTKYLAALYDVSRTTIKNVRNLKARANVQ